MQPVEREKGQEGEEGDEETLTLQGRGRVKGMPELEATGTHPGAHRPVQCKGAGRGALGTYSLQGCSIISYHYYYYYYYLLLLSSLS